MTRRWRVAVALLSSVCGSLRPMEVWLDARGVAPRQAEDCDLFDRVIVDAADAVPDDVDGMSTLVADAPAKGASKLRFADGSVAGGSIVVRCDEAQRAATALLGSVAWCHVDARGGQPMIVAENLLSAAEATGTKVACGVGASDDVPGLAFALLRGVDAIVLDADASPATLEAAMIAKAQRYEDADEDRPTDDGDGDERAPRRAADRGVVLTSWTISNVSDGGVADRVAIDLTTLLDPDEGCLVGSSAKALALVLGETATGGFVPPRPFRVNAGPVHSYVAVPDGRTKYLQEIVAGDEILVASTAGETRRAVVGRAKVEPRPTLRIDYRRRSDAAATHRLASVYLQQAETVRLAREDGSPLTVTEATPGDVVLVREDDLGTHVGTRISAKVDER